MRIVGKVDVVHVFRLVIRKSVHFRCVHVKGGGGIVMLAVVVVDDLMAIPVECVDGWS